jgi:hypothetical protein
VGSWFRGSVGINHIKVCVWRAGVCCLTRVCVCVEVVSLLACVRVCLGMLGLIKFQSRESVDSSVHLCRV